MDNETSQERAIRQYTLIYDHTNILGQRACYIRTVTEMINGLADLRREIDELKAARDA